MDKDKTLSELKARQDAELEALLLTNHTKSQRHRMAIRHVNEFTRLVKKLARAEARQKK